MNEEKDSDLMATPSRRVRLLIAVLATIFGGLAVLAGGWAVVYARLTGYQDPYHGGLMLLDAGTTTFFTGVALLGVAFILWPRRLRRFKE